MWIYKFSKFSPFSYSEYSPWEIIQKREYPFTFFVQKYPPLFVSVMFRPNSSNVHIEVFQMRTRFIMVPDDFTIWETLFHELTELVELFYEIYFFMPGCSWMVVTVRATIHVDLELPCVPILVKHR